MTDDKYEYNKVCNCMICKHNRGDISDDEYRKWLVDNLNTSTEPIDIDEFSWALYELETNGNAYDDDNDLVYSTINELYKRYHIKPHYNYTD